MSRHRHHLRGSLVLVVTEPTVSGLHRPERVLDLTAHFGVAASVCVNKGDINPEMTGEDPRLLRSARGSPRRHRLRSRRHGRPGGGKKRRGILGRTRLPSMRDLWEHIQKAMNPSIRQEDTTKNVQ